MSMQMYQNIGVNKGKQINKKNSLKSSSLAFMTLFFFVFKDDFSYQCQKSSISQNNNWN